MKKLRVATASILVGCATVAQSAVELKPVGRYQSPTAGFDTGAAEIVAYDATTQRIFVVNAQDGTVDVLDASNPANPTKDGQINAKALGSANSVAARDGLVAVAIEANPLTNNGVVAFYDAATLDFIRSVPAGALPDAVTFSNTGHFVIVSNEGEPRAPVDPEGSVTVIDVRMKGKGPGFGSCTVDFKAFNSQRAALVAAGVYIDPGAASVAQDLEPEYASAQGNNAYVTLQENNAIAVVQLNQCRVARIMPLGAKDHGLPQNSLDTSDREISGTQGRISLRSWQNLYALYQPDSIATYEAGDGEVYLVVANEGDVRDPSNSGRPADGVPVSTLTLDPAAFPPVPPSVSADPNPKSDKNLGRLIVNRTLGYYTDVSGQRVFDRLFAYGGRSFSIYTNDGRQVYDSANDFESIIANRVGSGELPPQAFNATHNNNSAGQVPGASTNTFDSRSDDKGPEPEGVVVGQVNDRAYAFIGLERVGGVMIYDVTEPQDAFYVGYVNNRDFSQGVCTLVSAVPAAPPSSRSGGACSNGIPNPLALDLGPEGLAFVPAKSSPNGKPLLIVGNEISGSTTVYEITATD
jgi:2',3'-cyclic-nucleotide 2'-phosphodiesterase / 3'-nucleotidase / 5'-nucleotidase